MPAKIRVFETPAAAQAREQRRTGSQRPEHWVDSCGTKFKNPYPSWRDRGFRDVFSMMSEFRRQSNAMVIPPNVNELIGIHKPVWSTNTASSEVTATWLGHASFLVEMPNRSPQASRGIRILFDPIFSERCSPVQWAGPKRYTPPPCQVEDLPDIDAVVISHDHYDHLDALTLCALYKRTYIPHIFTPIGYGSLLRSFSIPSTHIHELDWWDSLMLEAEVPTIDAAKAETSLTVKSTVEITCTPSQHNTSRTISDRLFAFHRLWASWVLREVPPDDSTALPKKVFFAGDTGYRSVLDGQDEDTAPTFPGFKQVGDRFGGIDLALIPIGAYQPRWFMSSDHCAPQDSVLIFKDVQAKKALAMHWGTFTLTYEPVMEPRELLKAACKKVGIEDGAFLTIGIGETRSS